MSKPIASLSLDLDNKWSYLKTHGDESWREFPTYLHICVPRILDFFAQHDCRITVFIVGQDAELEVNRDALNSITAAGHEVGNHSFHHEPWLHLYSPEQLNDELDRAENAILAATDKRPVGFRGPGFSFSQEVLKTLANRGYQYDASTFPTFLGPIARAYYFLRSSLKREEREQRKELFGSWKQVFRPNRPYYWQLDEQTLLEIPVTCLPLFRTPIHLSYLLYLASFSFLAARAYWWSTIQLCRMTNTQPSLLFHPLDFLGRDDDSDLTFFPGMNLESERKIEFVHRFVEMLGARFQLVNMEQHAEFATNQRLRTRPLDLAPQASM